MNTHLRHQLHAADPAGQTEPYSSERQDQAIAWAMAREVSTDPLTASVGHRRGWSKPRLGLLVAAATVTCGLVVGPAFGWFTGSPDPGSGATAAQVLHRAAQAARAEPVPVIRDDAFIYVDSVASWQTFVAQADQPSPAGVAKSGPAEAVRVAGLAPSVGSGLVAGPGIQKERRVWLSVDGRHVGLLKERPRGSSGAWESTTLANEDCQKGYYLDGANIRTGSMKCLVVPGYDADIPATEAGAMNWLRHKAGLGDLMPGTGGATPSPSGTSKPDPELVWVALGDTIREAYIAPAARAALFDAAAKIPGVRVVNPVVDAVGRQGIAVTWDSGDSSNQLVFDARSYAFLGEQDLQTTVDKDGTRHQTVTGYSAVLKVAVVAKAGTLP